MFDKNSGPLLDVVGLCRVADGFRSEVRLTAFVPRSSILVDDKNEQVVVQAIFTRAKLMEMLATMDKAEAEAQAEHDATK